ncbi:hypothetical protein ACJX0J_039237, partial [Zea mays]
ISQQPNIHEYMINRNVMITIILSFDFVNFTRTNLHIVDRSSFTIGDRVNLLQLAVSQARPILTCTRGIGQLHLLKGKHLFQSYFRLTFKHFQNKNKKEKKKQID